MKSSTLKNLIVGVGLLGIMITFASVLSSVIDVRLKAVIFFEAGIALILGIYMTLKIPKSKEEPILDSSALEKDFNIIHNSTDIKEEMLEFRDINITIKSRGIIIASLLGFFVVYFF
ncbi:MAG: hypothetical protein RR840_06050 [Clostridium sp.]